MYTLRSFINQVFKSSWMIVWNALVWKVQVRSTLALQRALAFRRRQLIADYSVLSIGICPILQTWSCNCMASVTQDETVPKIIRTNKANVDHHLRPADYHYVPSTQEFFVTDHDRSWSAVISICDIHSSRHSCWSHSVSWQLWALSKDSSYSLVFFPCLHWKTCLRTIFQTVDCWEIINTEILLFTAVWQQIWGNVVDCTTASSSAVHLRMQKWKSFHTKTVRVFLWLTAYSTYHVH